MKDKKSKQGKGNKKTKIKDGADTKPVDEDKRSLNSGDSSFEQPAEISKVKKSGSKAIFKEVEIKPVDTGDKKSDVKVQVKREPSFKHGVITDLHQAEESDHHEIVPEIVSPKKSALNNKDKLKYENEIKELKDKIKELQIKCEDYLMEREKALIEKDKIEIALQKTSLEIDIVDYDKKMLMQENRILNQKMIYQSENEIEKMNGGQPSLNCSSGSQQCVIF